MSGSVKGQMEVFLDSLDYDFEQFTLDEFARWLEQRRGRPIVFVEWELPPDVPGIFFCSHKLACDRINIMDIGPTVLDLFGVPVPGYCDGKTQMPAESS